MPDDELTPVVTEQDVDQEVDEDAAFSEDEEHVSDESQESEQVADEETQDEQVSDDTEDKSEPDSEQDTESSDDEEDEDLKRGKAILDAEEQERAEKERLENERREQEQAKETPHANKLVGERFEQHHFEALKNFIPQNLFPKEPVKLSDGTELDFKTLVTDYPELPFYVSAIANNLVRQMTESGFLVSNEAAQQQLSKVHETMDQRTFSMTVTHPEYGVPKAAEIADSQEFKDWYSKEKPEIQALGKSKDPWDHIRMFKRYLNKEVLGNAKAEVEKKDEQRRKKKDNFDAVHKTTIKSKGKRSSFVNPEDEEAAAFNSEDDE